MKFEFNKKAPWLSGLVPDEPEETFILEARAREEKAARIASDLNRKRKPGRTWRDELAGWSVDEVIECVSLGDDRAAIESELLALAPKAYEKHVSLSSVWSGLSDTAREAILAAPEMRPMDS